MEYVVHPDESEEIDSRENKNIKPFSVFSVGSVVDFLTTRKYADLLNRAILVLIAAIWGMGILSPFWTLEAARVPVKQTYDLAQQEARVAALVNHMRMQYGLPPLEMWNVLNNCARQHSQDMADGTVDFGHDGFEKRANRIQKAAPCHSVGENVAYTYHYSDPIAKAVEMWIASPHHYENMIGDYRETGVGIAYDADGRCYITQMFSKKRKS